MKKVFITGCFDLLHSGHIAFFKEASTYGELYVGIGSDKTIIDLKGRQPVNCELERLYMVKSIKHVHDAFINSGYGLIDFEAELLKLNPNIFIVNEDGYSPAKQEMCDKYNIELKVLSRIPDINLPSRSTTSLINSNICQLPYRIDLAGGWIDQPYVSKFNSGWVITLSLEPIVDYHERCGMSTSTRNAAKKIWNNYLPLDNEKKLAEILFKYENSPNSKFVSGAQDSIGICMSGLVRHYYNNDYWPTKFESIHDEIILNWLENHIYLVLLWPREKDLNLLNETYINNDNVKSLCDASVLTWEGIREMDLNKFSKGITDSFNSQVKMFPTMINEKVSKAINYYSKQSMGWKLAGAGGGGYLILISETPIKDAMKIKIRRKNSGF